MSEIEAEYSQFWRSLPSVEAKNNNAKGAGNKSDNNSRNRLVCKYYNLGTCRGTSINDGKDCKRGRTVFSHLCDFRIDGRLCRKAHRRCDAHPQAPQAAAAPAQNGAAPARAD